MWLCCNLNGFVLYITMDKFYIPWSHVVPSVNWMNMNKESKWNGRQVLASSGPRQGDVAGCYEHGNELSDFI